MKKPIKTDKAPAAIGPYSQAILSGGFLFASGQIPVIPETGEIPQGIEEQAKQVFKNIAAILEEAQLSFADVVKATVFLKDLADFEEVNEIYASAFMMPFPARSCVEVARLPKDVKIEIEIIAKSL